MSIAAYLQTELVALSNEARRKYPEIKEVTQQQPELHYAMTDQDVKKRSALNKACVYSCLNRQPSVSLRY